MEKGTSRLVNDSYELAGRCVAECHEWVLHNMGKSVLQLGIMEFNQVCGCHRLGLECGNRRTLWSASGQMLGWVSQNMDAE